MTVSLEHISKSYDGTEVLSDVSLHLEDGKIYCLMGASGIGKTTLLRILMGLEQPDQGKVLFQGRDVSESSERVRAGLCISAVFQEDRLIDFENARSNVRLASARSGRKALMKTHALAALEEILGALLEQDAWEKPVRELSGGMRRRTAIARALASPSDLLVMDEPFTGLDQKTKEKTVQAILSYRAGRTLLAVTHQEEDVQLLGAQKIELKVKGDSNG